MKKRFTLGLFSEFFLDSKPQRFSKPLRFLILTLTLTTALPAKLQSQLQKTEPPFWYSNMKNPELQVMFYGKNISGYEVSVDKNVPITSVIKTENPNYLFVTIDTKNVAATNLTFTFSEARGAAKGKTKFTKTYELKQRKKDSSLREGFNSSDLIYLIMPDRFANGDASNDSSSETVEKANRSEDFGRHGGDIKGIIDNLDYIQGLGATTVWNTPLCEDNEKRGTYHGYAQTDVYKIDPRYGTNDDYLKLSSELHKRKMKLVLDYVTNHWGAEHWMVKDLPSYDWLHQFPGYAQSNYRMTTQFDPNASQIDKKYCVDGWFVKSMPDLNQSNPMVVKYLTQNAIWWIEYADLDGFRVDTYSYCDKKGIAEWTKAITDEYPRFNIVGEVWMHDQAQMAYWQKDSKIGAIQNYNSYLPSVMDFTLHDAIESAFSENEASWDKGMIKMYDNFANDFLYPNINSILVFAENHDTQRFNQRYKDLATYKMAMSLIATIRGIPEIYYGSEIGMQGDKGKGDGDIRRDFPGGWKGDPHNAFTASGRNETETSYFDFSSKLFNWRKNKSVIHNGKTLQFIPENNVYVYFRYDEKETVMVVINNSDKPQTFKTVRFAERIKDFNSGKDVVSGKSIDLKQDVAIEPKTAYILELR